MTRCFVTLRPGSALVGIALLSAASLAHAQTTGPTVLGSSNVATGYTQAIHDAVTTSTEAGKETYLLCRVDNATYGTQLRHGPKTRLIPGAGGEVTWENPNSFYSSGRCRVSTGTCDALDFGSIGGSCALGWKVFEATLTTTPPPPPPQLSLKWSATDKTPYMYTASTTAFFNGPTGSPALYESARSTSSITGKVAFAVTMAGPTSSNVFAGVTNPSHVMVDGGGGTDSIGLYYNLGQVRHNGALVTYPSVFGAGAEAAFAVDVDARLLWVSVNGGDWNNNSSANPAAGTGGVSFSGIVGPFHILGTIFQPSGPNALALHAPIMKPVPSGFTVP